MKQYLLAFFAIVATASLTALASDQSVRCETAMTMLEINECALIELNSAEAELEKYLAASIRQHKHDPELVKSIKQAQKDWHLYRKSHCDAVYTQWIDGSIRVMMSVTCQTLLTQQRTHDIWRYFLTFMDSTQPVLPEPKL